MKLHHRNQTRRRGFTLIELIVVIAIIAVLMALLVGAAMKVWGKGRDVKNRNDITQLSNAVVKFQSDFHVTYIPSRIRLAEVCGNYFPGGARPAKGTIEFDSLAYLQQLFPKADLTSSGKIDWNGNGTAGDSDTILEGDQCLVFFLGGIPTTGANGALGCTGFSLAQKDPGAHAAAGYSGPPPWKPSYEGFQAGRLTNFHGNGYWSYQDAYGKPFAYFSAYGRTNGYNRYTTSDCGFTGTSLGLFPYAEAPHNPFPDLRYVKADSFQIISAGADLQFGPGTAPAGSFFWSQATAGSIPAPGQDDQSNFAAGRLSAG